MGLLRASQKSGKKLFKFNRFSLILIGLLVLSGTASAAGILLIGKQPDGSVIVPSNQTIRPAGTTTELNQRPVDIALRPDGKQIAAMTTRYTFLIDAQTGKVTAQFDRGDRSFAGLAFSPDGKVVYYSKGGSQQIGFARINPDGTAIHTDQDVINIATKKSSNGNAWLSYPAGLSISPDGKTLFVAMFGSNELGLVDLATNKQTGTVDTASTPFGAYVSPDGQKVYVTNWGGPLPGPNDPPANVGLRYPIKQNPETGTTVAGSISVYDVKTGKMENNLIKTGLHPTAVTFAKNSSRLFVTNSNEDTVSVIALNGDRQNQELERISVKPIKELPFGSMPNGVVLNDKEGLLYVANGGNNAVGVIKLGKLARPSGENDAEDRTTDAARTNDTGTGDKNEEQDQAGASKIAGFIPTEWFPVGVLLNQDGSKIYVANNKGIGSLAGTLNPDTANPANYAPGYVKYYGQPAVPGKYVKSVTGSVSFINKPNDDQLEEYTKAVIQNSNYQAALLNAQKQPRQNVKAVPVPERVGEPSVFKHVIYIIKENRTYDQVLGDLGRGNGDSRYTNFPAFITPNQHALADQYGVLDNFYTSTLNSADGHQWTNEAVTNIFGERIFNNYPTNGEPLHGSYGDSNLDLTPLSVYENAMIHGKSVANYGESGGDGNFTNVYKNGQMLPPDTGFTWTDTYQDFKQNLLAGKKPVFTYDTVAFPPPLDRAINRNPGFQATSFANYDELISDQIRFYFWEQDFDKYVKQNKLPDFTVMVLPQDHTSGADPEQPTPRAMVADNDLALGRVVDKVSHSPFWKDTVIFVVEDDSQSGVDHVDGHRTIAYAISAYNKQQAGKGTVDSTYYNQTSMVRTIEQILGIPPMNQFDLTATLMTGVFQDTPNLNNAYTYKPSNIDITCLNKEFFTNEARCQKEIGYKSAAVARADALASSKLSKIRDGNNPVLLDAIIWRATMGDVPMPEPEWKKAQKANDLNGTDTDD